MPAKPQRSPSDRDQPPGTRPRVAGLVLAAGGARRFGGPKQLARIDGVPLLEHALAALAAVEAVDPVVVALGAHADDVLAAVDLHGARPLVVADWAEGQAASLRAGVAALAEHADAIVVVLGDQARLDPTAIERVLAAWDGAAPAVRATHGSRPGHPVLLAREMYSAVLALHGDAGARGLLRDTGVVEVPCDAGTVFDIDTAADLERLRDGKSQG